MVYSGAWGKLMKKPEVENLVALSLSIMYKIQSICPFPFLRGLWEHNLFIIFLMEADGKGMGLLMWEYY